MSESEDQINSGVEHMENAGTEVKSGTEDFKSAAATKAKEFRATAEAKAGEIREKAEQAWGGAQAKAQTYREDGEQYVRENPTQAILTALGVGFFLGLLFRSK